MGKVITLIVLLTLIGCASTPQGRTIPCSATSLITVNKTHSLDDRAKDYLINHNNSYHNYCID